MALVVLCAVLKIPVMRPGCVFSVVASGRLTVLRSLRAFLNRVGGGQLRGHAIDFGFSSILVDRDGIGMRDAGNGAPHGALTGIFGQQIHLTPQFLLIHARSSSGCAAATATTLPSTAGWASIVVVPATPSGWHPAASPTSASWWGSTAFSRRPSRSQGWWWRGLLWTFSDTIGQLVVVETHRVQQGIHLIFGHVPSKNSFHDVDLSGTKSGRG